MKKIYAVLLTAVLLVYGLAGCGADALPPSAADSKTEVDVPVVDTASDAKIQVVTTIFPPYDFVRQIAGDRVELTMLLSPGAESHSYEPTPQDIITIQNADVFIYVGGGADRWVDRILESMDTGNKKIVAMTDLVDTVTEVTVEGMEAKPHAHDEEEDHAHEEGDHAHDSEAEHAHHEEEEGHTHDGEEAEHSHDDEHVWTSLANAQTIVQALGEALGAVDPANQTAYRDNAAAYIEDLGQLDQAYRDVMEKRVRSTIVFGDRFPFRYLTDDYGLTYFAAFPGCSTDTEASAGTVAFLIDKVKDEEIPVVFHIEFSNEKMADTIQDSTGAEKRLLHSCHNVSKDDFERGVTYLELMTENLNPLKEALL